MAGTDCFRGPDLQEQLAQSYTRSNEELLECCDRATDAPRVVLSGAHLPGAQIMGTFRVAAIAVIVAGVLALLYGGFSYTTENTAAKLGPLELKVEERNRVNVPMWAGVAAIVAGRLVLVGVGRK